MVARPLGPLHTARLFLLPSWRLLCLTVSELSPRRPCLRGSPSLGALLCQSLRAFALGKPQGESFSSRPPLCWALGWIRRRGVSPFRHPAKQASGSRERPAMVCLADPGLPVGLCPRSSPPTPDSCARSAACFAAWAAVSVCARAGSFELRLGPGPGTPRAASVLSPHRHVTVVTPALGGGVAHCPGWSPVTASAPSRLRAQARRAAGQPLSAVTQNRLLSTWRGQETQETVGSGHGRPGLPPAQPHEGVCREAPICSAPAPSLRSDPLVVLPGNCEGCPAPLPWPLGRRGLPSASVPSMPRGGTSPTHRSHEPCPGALAQNRGLKP